MDSAKSHATKIDGIECYAKTNLPLSSGIFEVRVFRVANGDEHLSISMGDLTKNSPIFLRIHSECFTGEVLNSLRCDCKEQLDEALASIAKLGHGILIYLRNQDGRGIGLGNKIRAYHLQQNEGLDTIQANHALGFPSDLRDFTAAIKILRFLGIKAVSLNTNNPAKILALKGAGISVAEIVPSLATLNPHNTDYLKTKFAKLGHHLDDLFEPKVSKEPKKKNKES